MEQPAATGGNALLILVGLSVMFLLIVALLGAAKAGGSLFSESNLLYVALIFYAGAGALYMGFGVTGTARYVTFASSATAIGWSPTRWPSRIAGICQDVRPSPASTRCC